MDVEVRKELLSLIFDSDIIYQISYIMCVNALKKSDKQKQEEDLYVIEKNLAEINGFFQEIKKQNNFSNYMNLLRYLEYEQKPKYSTVFNYDDNSDQIFFLMRGQVCVLLPDTNYEFNRYSMDIKRNALKKLQSLQNRHKELKNIFEQHINPNFQIKRVYKNPSDDDDDDEDEQEDEEAQQPWGYDIQIINLIHPQFFCAKVLQQNDYFGEIGVEFNVPRSATIVCKTDCEFAILPAKVYSTEINNKFYSEDKFVSRLRDINYMFKTMSKQMINVFASQTHVQICNSHTNIFKINDKADYIYFIEKGQVEIYQNYFYQDLKLPNEDMDVNPIYQEQTQANSISEFQVYKLKAAILEKGQYFGEDGIIYKRQQGIRITQAYAKTQCILLRIKKDFFYNNFKAFFESDKLNESIIQENLKTIKMKTQENEEYEQYYCSVISKKIKELKHSKDNDWKTNTPQRTREETQISEIMKEEDDILNTKKIKKNLFELYKEEKTNLFYQSKNTLTPQTTYKREYLQISPLSIQKRSTLKFEHENNSQFGNFVEDYLYPQVNMNLNPNLFVKKTKKKYKSGRSVSQITIKTPKEQQNLGTPTNTYNQFAESHTSLKFKGSQSFNNTQQFSNKIQTNQKKVQKARSNQQTPVKVNTPNHSRAQSALIQNFKNNMAEQNQLHQNETNQTNLSNNRYLGIEQNDFTIKIQQTGNIVQDFQSPPKIANFNIKNVLQMQLQSALYNQDKHIQLDKLTTKSSLYYIYTKRCTNHCKSASQGGPYSITRSLKEDNKSTQLDKNKSLNSQSQSLLHDTKQKNNSKEKYGIDSKFLIKEKLSFLINAKEKINQHSQRLYNKPLIKFKSLNTVPYKTGQIPVSQIKKFSTLNAQELVKSINQSNAQINNLNNSNIKSPLITKVKNDQLNSTVSSFFTFMSQPKNNNQSNNYLGIHKKINSFNIQNQ
ncbi:hypothetical protein ABPG72_006273 [Tetrahymena utriculariae]